MKYELKNCKNGEAGVYPTTVDISVKDGIITFFFECENCKFFVPFTGYNKIHSAGDSCEILIGSDPERKVYYEIEISAKGELMIAKMTYNGADETGEPILDIDFSEECFAEAEVKPWKDGYTCKVSFPLEKIMTGEGEIYFNAQRLDTDGGVYDKHLWALSPTMFPRFHRPWYFVYLKDYVK